ncbi:MAG: hypothetical protein WCK87_01155 [Candidatus Saccharibacteria bacterium]
MLKDIYSPLEIDEQWDQRAPMAEGDSSMGAMGLMGEMQSAAADAGGATAVLEAPPAAPVPAETIAEATEPASPAADDSSETMPDPMSTPTETTEDSKSETDTSSDDKAAAMLGGTSQTDIDKDATPDPLAQIGTSGDAKVEESDESTTAAIKQITQPVVEYKPDPRNELKQPTAELETAELTNDATKDVDDASEQAVPEITNDHTSADSAESADEDSLAKIASSENEEETKPAITLDSAAEMGASENQAQDSIDSIDKGVEVISNQAKAYSADIDSQIAHKTVKRDDIDKELSELKNKKLEIGKRLVLLSQVTGQ